MKLTLTGIDLLERKPTKYLGKKRSKRIAALCHPASVSRTFTHLATILEKHGKLAALFGPQHGIYGETQDNMIEWQDHRDGLGRPIYSLYGERRKPSHESLKDIDLVVIDLFDVGARYYTFIYTMAYMIEACGELGIPVLICDRPNPLGGDFIEGPLLNTEFKSFVGLYPIPVCHGMTVGELAHFFTQFMNKVPPIEVIRLQNWKRGFLYPKTGLPWTLPSPNMPNFEAAVLYPGMCLLEGTTLSEGRGTTRPFELIGAPFIDWDLVEKEYQKEAKKLKLKPIIFHRQGFIPTFHKFQGEVCKGALQVSQMPGTFMPTRHAILLLWVLRKLYSKSWAWKQPPYEYEYHKLPIDILMGGTQTRECIDTTGSLKNLFQTWRNDEERFKKLRRPYLMY